MGIARIENDFIELAASSNDGVLHRDNDRCSSCTISESDVGRWYFEVWNEPNIDFWDGVPKQSTYFELCDHTARALKSVSTRLRVGGPATAAADWVDAFLAHAEKENVNR